MSKLNFNKARMIFLLKSNMIETKANFKGQPLCYTVHADSYLRIEKPKKHEREILGK